MIAYQVFEEKNHEGRYFKEWELPAGFPIPHDFVLVPPGADMIQPKFDHAQGIWVEDEESLLKTQLIDTQLALTELYELMLGKQVG